VPKTSSIVLLVWRLTVRASRQADGTQTRDSGHSVSRVPGGGEGSARRNGATETLMVQWGLAARDRCVRR